MSKIQLSAKEYELVNNADWFLTKREIIEKVYLLFAKLIEEIRMMAQGSSIEKEINSRQAKISRGENYHGLPYVILDYPGLFSKEEIFAIRIMFWWANHFSVTLHLRGNYMKRFLPSNSGNSAFLDYKDLYIATTGDEWMHHVEGDHYTSMKDLSNTDLSNLCEGKDFIKVTGIVPLTEWDNAVERILEIYRKMHDLIGD